MSEQPEWETWLANQEDWNGDTYYRGVYDAYLAASQPDPDHFGDCRLRIHEDGSIELSTNGHYEPLRLASAEEAQEFARWLETRLCNTVPTMRAWHDRAHGWAVSDRSDWI